MSTAQHAPGLTPSEQGMLNTLELIQSNLRHQRRFGLDSYGGWRNACVQAERDLEAAVIDVKEEGRRAALAKAHETPYARELECMSETARAKATGSAS